MRHSGEIYETRTQRYEQKTKQRGVRERKRHTSPDSDSYNSEDGYWDDDSDGDHGNHGDDDNEGDHDNDGHCR